MKFTISANKRELPTMNLYQCMRCLVVQALEHTDEMIQGKCPVCDCIVYYTRIYYKGE